MKKRNLLIALTVVCIAISFTACKKLKNNVRQMLQRQRSPAKVPFQITLQKMQMIYSLRQRMILRNWEQQGRHHITHFHL
jgi:hypothetical protein